MPSRVSFDRILGCLLPIALVVSGCAHARDGTDPPLPGFAELEAAGAIIGRIEIVNANIFDTDDPRENNALFRAANRLHVVSRRSTIARHMLFSPGEKVSAARIEETERLLRGSGYLYDVRIRPLALRDGVVDIEVATRDSWTLYPVISVARSGGKNKTEFSLTDVNVFGTGSTLNIGTVRDVDRRSRQFDFANPNLFGPWIGLGIGVARNSDGSSQRLSVQRPFYALDARWSAGLRATRDDRLEPVYNAGELASEYRRRERSVDGHAGWSRGLVDGWVQRYTLGLSLYDSRNAPEPGRVAPAELPPDRRLIGPYFRYELIEDRFQRLQNRNLVGRPEYFALGLSARLQLGWSAPGLGASEDALLYEGAVSRGIDLSGVSPGQVLQLAASIDGRYGDGETRQQRTGLAATHYLPHHHRWLFYTALSAALLTGPDPAEFLYLGGDNGLRGYPLRYQSGTRRALLTLEERLYTGAFPFRLFRVGAAAFVDVGRAWGGDNPNARNPGWLADVGLGLRLFSVRTAQINVLHLDVAFPLEPTTDIRRVQFLASGKASF